MLKALESSANILRTKVPHLNAVPGYADLARQIASSDCNAGLRLTRVMLEDPAGRQLLQCTMLALYQEEVVVDGVACQARHDKYVERYGDISQIIFPDHKNVIHRFGQSVAAATESIQRGEMFETDVTEQFPGMLLNLSPEAVVITMLEKRFSETDANRFRNLAMVANFIVPYQNALCDVLQQRLFEHGCVSPAKIDYFLDAHQGVVTGLLGPAYSRDLRRLVQRLNGPRQSSQARSKNPALALLWEFTQSADDRHSLAGHAMLAALRRVSLRLMREKIIDPALLGPLLGAVCVDADSADTLAIVDTIRAWRTSSEVSS